MLNWLQHADWPAVIAALVALYNAVMHKKTFAVQQQQHVETMQTLKGGTP